MKSMDPIAQLQERITPQDLRRLVKLDEKTQNDASVLRPPRDGPSQLSEDSQESQESDVTLVNHSGAGFLPIGKPPSRIPAVSDTFQVGISPGSHHQTTKKDTIRSIFRTWRRTLPKFKRNHTTSSTSSQNSDSIATDLVTHLCIDFSMFIQQAILDSPSQTKSTLAICKHIMRADDWYRTHQECGWQQIVAQQLVRSPAFRPVIQCRKGKIRRSKSVKWQLVSNQFASTQAIPTSAWRSPLEMTHRSVELADTAIGQNIENTVETSGASATAHAGAHDTPVMGSSATPLCQEPHFESFLMGLNSSPRSEPTLKSKDCHLKNSEKGTGRSTGKKPLKHIEFPEESLASGLQSSSSGPKRWELYDKPAEMPLEHTTCNGYAPADSQTKESPEQSDKSDSTGESPDSDKGHRSRSNGRKGPGRPEDGNGDRKRKRLRSPDRYMNRRRFACVYHKYDPGTYGVHDRRYLVCAGAGFEFTSELIRHLGRTHGEHICGRCLKHFDNAQLRNMHKDQCTVRLRCSQEDRWAGLWRARFPNVPVPEDPYLSNSLRPAEPRVDTQIELTPNQAHHGSSSSSSTNPSTPSLLSDTASHTPNPTLQVPAAPNSDIHQDKGLPLQTSATIQLMECRIDCLEKRLPGVEDTLRLVLRLVGPSFDHPSRTPIPVSHVTAQTTSHGDPSNNPYAPCNYNTFSRDLRPHHAGQRGPQTIEAGSNCPPFGSSCSSSSGSSSRDHSNQEINTAGLDQPPVSSAANTGTLANKGDGEGDIADFLMSDFYFEAWNDEQNLFAIPLPPNI